MNRLCVLDKEALSGVGSDVKKNSRLTTVFSQEGLMEGLERAFVALSFIIVAYNCSNLTMGEYNYDKY